MSTLNYNRYNGKVTGVTLDDGRFVPQDMGNRHWQDYLTANPGVDLSDQPPSARRARKLIDIIGDLNALAPLQKSNITTDLFGGSPPKWSQYVGPNAASQLVYYTMTQLVTLSQADKNLIRIHSISMYVQDNPTYLVTPGFDPTINVPGDELIT